MKLVRFVLLALLLSLLVGLVVGTIIRLRLEKPVEYIGMEAEPTPQWRASRPPCRLVTLADTKSSADLSS